MSDSLDMSRRQFAGAAVAATVFAATASIATAEEAPAEAAQETEEEPPAVTAGGAFGDFTREEAPNKKQAQVTRETLPSFMQQKEVIPTPEDAREYDVVVVGAGASGLSAALSAVEQGVRVACLQKEERPSSQGYGAAGLDLDKTEPAAAAAAVSYFIEKHEYRPDRRLVQVWADNSGEAIKWLMERFAAAGVDAGTPENSASVNYYYGYPATTIIAMPEGSFAGSCGDLADYAAEQGVDFYYSTPGVQLEVENGAVTGVIGKNPDGSYTLFKAAKGVILATGDYQNDEDMVAYYNPDSLGFPPLQSNRTGDGHRMGIWAGGRLEPIGHTKMIHDGWGASTPFLMVDIDGKRFMNENMDWELVSCMIRNRIQHAKNPADANLFSIIDANYAAQAEEWGEIEAKYGLTKDVPEYYKHTADTLEGLAEEIGVPAEQLVATVERYNELCEKGADEDFGKDARFLKPITEPPFIAVGRDYWWGQSAIIGGLVINADNNVLDDDDNPIPGLFAVGNVSGPFYGSADYHFAITCMSLGRAVTGGYVAGRYVANL